MHLEVGEYVILDNLLRRHLTPEKQAYLLDDLSKQYENKEDQPRTKDGKFTVDANVASTDKEDVNDKTVICGHQRLRIAKDKEPMLGF